MFDCSSGDIERENLSGKSIDGRERTKTAKLSAAAIDLVREAAARDGVRLGGLPPPDIARLVKAVPVHLTGVAGIARAISTAGGVSFEEVDGNFMLRKLPGVFVAGEMLDCEAPTGGYLLQAAFATGVAAADGAIAWMARADSNIDLAAMPGRTLDPTLPPNVQSRRSIRLISPTRRHILRPIGKIVEN